MAYIQADQNGIKTVTGKNWRLIHNGIQVMALFEGEDEGSAGGNTQIFVVATKAEAEAEIARLGLFVPEHIGEQQ
jgi:hypothetical protein